jgi:hypothetical protein
MAHTQATRKTQETAETIGKYTHDLSLVLRKKASRQSTR